MAEVDYWSATRKAFEPLQLPEPEFTDKHLKRPPFRFIFDIITNINKRFAAYDHIFTLDQLDYASIDSKEKKIDYLKRLIKYVEKLLKVKIDVSAKKIVAGQESEKTNVFLQYVAMAVGLAQQDKQRRMSEPLANPPTTSAAAGGASTSGGGAPSTATNDSIVAGRGSVTFANPADFGLPNLPHRDSLPRKKSSASRGSSSSFSPVDEQKKSLLKEVEAFNLTLAGYHLNLHLDDGRDITAEGQSLVKMWNEMKEVKTDTTPSTIPVEALETAIQRQIDNIKQIHELLEKNEEVLSHLENVLT